MVQPDQARGGSSARALAWIWAGLIVYATLYPFAAWRWPPGADAWQLLVLPWPRWVDRFDITANLVGYLPLGGLLYVAGIRARAGRRQASTSALGLATLLSYGLEVTQHLLPQRVPSSMDWALNTLGAAAGVALALALHAWGALAVLRVAVNRWVQRRGLGGALLLAWPVALLFPTPVPLGLGQVGAELREWATWMVADVPWAAPAQLWLDAIEPVFEPLSPVTEWLAVTLGLLGPCLVAYAASRPGWRRVPLAMGAVVLGASVTSLATALAFGPQHATAWRTATTVPALLAGFVLALVLVRVGPRLAAALGLLAITVMLVLVAQAPADPYFAQSLEAWERGRFIHFHGAVKWVGWLWPYAALAWLLHRLSSAE